MDRGIRRGRVEAWPPSVLQRRYLKVYTPGLQSCGGKQLPRVSVRPCNRRPRKLPLWTAGRYRPIWSHGFFEDGGGEPMAELRMLGVAEVVALVRRREVSPVEVVEDCLKRIEAVEPTLQAWV